MAYLDKYSTLDPVMVSVVSSIPTGGNFLKFFKLLDVNFGLKCKCDLIVKNSIVLHGWVEFARLLHGLNKNFRKRAHPRYLFKSVVSGSQMRDGGI